jgi:CO/xanthine dehydrogenase FAD-binding subunit
MDVFAPVSLDEALEIKGVHPEAVPVAGGTDVMVDINLGRLRPPALLDLSRVDELKAWRVENGVVFLGAGMTFARVERELEAFRPLAGAARSVGSVQIRNRATIGGNLGTASPAGDSLPVLAAYGAQVVTASAGRSPRRVPWGEFFVGPKRTSLAPDELIVGVEWRPLLGPGSFTKVGPRSSMLIAVASVCVQLDETGHGIRLGLGSVGPTVLRAGRAERFAAQALDWDDPAAGLAEFGRLAAAEAQPIDDIRGSAAYRRHVVDVLARRALVEALDERRRDRC